MNIYVCAFWMNFSIEEYMYIFKKRGEMDVFLYDVNLPIIDFTLLVLYTFALVGLNEIARRSLKSGLFMYVLVPIFLVLFIWPHTLDESINDWFNIAKMIAILSFSWIVLALRFSKKIQSISWFKYLVPLFLTINMVEAILKDFELSSLNPGMYEGIYRYGGGWNIANGVAGILNIILICGFVGIYIAKDKEKTMVWPDMLFWWIIAYDFWNYTFIYNNGGGRSFYMGGALIAAGIATHFIKRGAWMQHRVFTLVLNQYFLWILPSVFLTSDIAVQASYDPAANWTLSLISLGLNVSLLIYQGYTMYTKKRNGYTGEIFVDTKEYQKTIAEYK